MAEADQSRGIGYEATFLKGTDGIVFEPYEVNVDNFEALAFELHSGQYAGQEVELVELPGFPWNEIRDVINHDLLGIFAEEGMTSQELLTHLRRKYGEGAEFSWKMVL